ncbi:MAG: M56 family metallopeptidase [Muribaculaceae bacterium]|nr:M56 family metallopeptidase [Muribaculaceae bacterium]
MGAFLSYSLVSGLFMLALYLAYRLFLSRENQHGFNRGVLLMIYLISFSMPILLSIAEKINPDSQAASVVLEIDIVGVVDIAPPLWGTVLIWVYIAGIVAVATKTVYTWIKLSGVVRKGEKIRHEDYTLVITDNEKYAPFSWMRYVVISRGDYENKCTAIIVHELKHIKSQHWVDLLIAQVVCIVDWFNPASWLMRDELMLVHEYQADMAVIDNGNDPQEYQMLLIKKAVGSRFPSLANSLNHSKLKKRITMMSKEKSGAGHKFKALALVPMLALALGLTAVPAVRAAVSTISNSEIALGKGSENTLQEQTSERVFKLIKLNNNGEEVTVVISGENLGNMLSVSDCKLIDGALTVDAKSLQSNMTDGTATITATFHFSGDYNNSIVTFNANGQVISFNLADFKNNAQAGVVGKTGSSMPVTAPEVMPQYPGGEGAMFKALVDEIKYVEGPQKAGASGRAVIKFTVNANGEMQDFEVMQSSGYGDLDAEAIRAIKEGLKERWIPGTVDGKPVSVSYSIPITFRLK